ncbi:hypothetical protein D3C80_1009300 [compost metagenome]
MPIQVGPFGGQVGAARQAEILAGAVARQFGAVAGFVDGLDTPTQGQARVGEHVRLEHAIHQRLLGVADVLEILLVGIGRHQAPAQLAIEGNGPGDIQLAAVIVPGPGRHIDAELVNVQRALAHQVDDAARVAGAPKQPRGAAQHFDMVELGQVVGLVRIEAAGRGAKGHGGGAVDLDVLDGKAAGIKGRQAVIAVLYDHTRGFFHGIGQVGHVPVLDGLLGDHRHRLRHLGETGRGLRTHAGQAGGVGAGILGHLAHALALDGNGVQFHGR